MTLFDQEKIRLQDPISRFIPQSVGTDKATLNIRTLLLHESGLPAFIPFQNVALDRSSSANRFIPGLLSERRTDHYNYRVAQGVYASRQMHEQILSDILAANIRNRGRYLYSCLNFILLHKVVENVAQTDFHSFLQQNLFRRLGATSTTFKPLNYMSIDLIPATENDPTFRRQHIRGHAHDEAAALFGGVSGNAGLFSNATDLAKLAQMWLNEGKYGGERFLSEETVRLFTATRSGVSRRGLGFDRVDPRNSNAAGSPSTPLEAYGHAGFTGTAMWVDPANNLIYIFLSNRVNPSRSPNRLNSLNIRERIQEEVYRIIAEAESAQ